jgi:hypothetical protein
VQAFPGPAQIAEFTQTAFDTCVTLVAIGQTFVVGGQPPPQPTAQLTTGDGLQPCSESLVNVVANTVTWVSGTQDSIVNLQNTDESLANAINDVQDEIATGGGSVPANLLDLAAYVEVDPNPINGVAGPNILFTGANVHIRNGMGQTDTTNGLGNLIVGYNEAAASEDLERFGSHNAVIGPLHRFISFGGLVAGSQNAILAPGNFVAGKSNMAYAIFSSIAGGEMNSALGTASSVSGGFFRAAGGDHDWAAGGLFQDDVTSLP